MTPLHTPPDDWDWGSARQQCLRCARRLLADDHDAEEAVQEALARAWRKRHQCRDSASAVAWMLQITRNEALRKVAQRRETAALDSAAESAEEVADDEVIRRIEVRRALARLSAEDRALLALRYDHDLTQSAVAERTGLPEGTVKVRLHRLRYQLRGVLRDL